MSPSQPNSEHHKLRWAKQTICTRSVRYRAKWIRHKRMQWMHIVAHLRREVLFMVTEWSWACIVHSTWTVCVCPHSSHSPTKSVWLMKWHRFDGKYVCVCAHDDRVIAWPHFMFIVRDTRDVRQFEIGRLSCRRTTSLKMSSLFFVAQQLANVASETTARNQWRAMQLANLMRNKCSQLKLSVAKNENNWKFDGRCAMHGCQESIRKWDIFITYSFDIRRNRDNEHAMRFTAHHESLFSVCVRRGEGEWVAKNRTRRMNDAKMHMNTQKPHQITATQCRRRWTERQTDRQTTITCAMPFDCCHCYSLAAVAICPLLRIVMHSGAWLSTLQ